MGWIAKSDLDIQSTSTVLLNVTLKYFLTRFYVNIQDNGIAPILPNNEGDLTTRLRFDFHDFDACTYKHSEPIPMKLKAVSAISNGIKVKQGDNKSMPRYNQQSGGLICIKLGLKSLFSGTLSIRPIFLSLIMRVLPPVGIAQSARSAEFV